MVRNGIRVPFKEGRIVRCWLVIHLVVVVHLIIVGSCNISFIRIIIFSNSIKIVNAIDLRLFPTSAIPNVVNFLFTAGDSGL